MMVYLGQRFKVMVDGMGFHIQELAPFDPNWYSHKFNRSGSHYEIGVCIKTRWIVWSNRTFPACEWPHWKITRLAINHQLHDHEGYVGDAGHYDG